MFNARVKAKVAARMRYLDGGVTVRRALPMPRLRSVGPFVFLDQMGPVPFAPGQGIDVMPHPHIGLATATYLFDGAITHRDSLGYDQVIRPGDLSWMTAGRGIVHSERTEPSARKNGGSLFGVQAWAALPRSHEEAEPRFEHHPKARLPVVEADGVRIRVLAGALHGAASPVRFPAEITFFDVRAEPERAIRLPRTQAELGLYVASGALQIEGERFAMGDLCVFDESGDLAAQTLAPSRFLVIGGSPIDAPRHMFWNFVASRPERIEQAKEDWRRGCFEAVVGETDRLPLPDDTVSVGAWPRS